MLTADNAYIADIYNTDKSFILLTKFFLASDKKFYLADKNFNKRAANAEKHQWKFHSLTLLSPWWWKNLHSLVLLSPFGDVNVLE
jgi:hypothetical protein